MHIKGKKTLSSFYSPRSRVLIDASLGVCVSKPSRKKKKSRLELTDYFLWRVCCDLLLWVMYLRVKIYFWCSPFNGFCVREFFLFFRKLEWSVCVFLGDEVKKLVGNVYDPRALKLWLCHTVRFIRFKGIHNSRLHSGFRNSFFIFYVSSKVFLTAELCSSLTIISSFLEFVCYCLLHMDVKSEKVDIILFCKCRNLF